MTSTPTGLLETLEHQIQYVEKQLTTCSDNQSLCQLGKTRKAPNDLKYYEGRYAVLKKWYRLLQSQSNLDSAALARLFASDMGNWREQWQKHQSQNSSGDWVAYSQGSLDSCIEIEILLAQVLSKL